MYCLWPTIPSKERQGLLVNKRAQKRRGEIELERKRERRKKKENKVSKINK